ncbi:MAG: PH domain-containing protein [Sciscionella sp.]
MDSREHQDTEGAPGSAPPPVVARPHRIRIIVIPVAVLLVAVFAAVGVLLKHGSTGVNFDTSDQASMVVLGIVLAAAVLLLLRPRVRADADGIEVRSVLLNRRYRWSETYGLSFPDGARWARLDLPDDEYVPVMAIQALDSGRAVTAMRDLRALYRASGQARTPDL